MSSVTCLLQFFRISYFHAPNAKKQHTGISFHCACHSSCCKTSLTHPLSPPHSLILHKITGLALCTLDTGKGLIDSSKSRLTICHGCYIKKVTTAAAAPQTVHMIHATLWRRSGLSRADQGFMLHFPSTSCFLEFFSSVFLHPIFPIFFNSNQSSSIKEKKGTHLWNHL